MYGPMAPSLDFVRVGEEGGDSSPYLHSSLSIPLKVWDVLALISSCVAAMLLQLELEDGDAIDCMITQEGGC